MKQFPIFMPIDFKENFAGIVSFNEIKSEILAEDRTFLAHKICLYFPLKVKLLSTKNFKINVIHLDIDFGK